MGVGPNYVLDKPFLATGATAYAFGEIVKLIAGSGSFSTTANSVVRNTTATVLTTTDVTLAVAQEDLDTVRLATGKAFINCRLMGIARVQCGATVTVGDHVTNDATARAVKATRAAGGAQPIQILGIALSGGTVGQHIDVLLTPGVSF